MVRCFITILIPEELKDRILPIQDEIKKLPLKYKLVERENLHINLSFLGETEESKLVDVGNTLEKICGKTQKFQIVTDGIKIIPNEHYIRVLAIDILPNKTLEDLQKEIKDQIGGSVNPPHLTLCRVKGVMDKTAVVGRLKNMGIQPERFNVDSIYLMQSTLKKTGPVYTIINKFDLHYLG